MFPFQIRHLQCVARPSDGATVAESLLKTRAVEHEDGGDTTAAEEEKRHEEQRGETKSKFRNNRRAIVSVSISNSIFAVSCTSK